MDVNNVNGNHNLEDLAFTILSVKIFMLYFV